MQGLDLDPEPTNSKLRTYTMNIVDTVRWAGRKGYVVTAAPFDFLDTWADILEATVDSATGLQHFARFYVQL
jgi:hypothetical protein